MQSSSPAPKVPSSPVVGVTTGAVGRTAVGGTGAAEAAA